MKLLLQEETPVIRKTKELCQALLDQPAYRQLRAAIDAFLDDAESVARYRELCDLQDNLARKQSENLPLGNDEIAQFERAERAFLDNPRAQSFIAAQRQMHQLEHTVSTYVRKTFELGRVPEESDLHGGCGCGGGGCGCGS